MKNEINGIIDLDSRNNELIECAKNAKLVLGDLYQNYIWAGEYPTAEEAKRLSYDTERIITYISIANDYVCRIKEGLEKSTLDLDSLLDKVRKLEIDSKKEGKKAQL